MIERLLVCRSRSFDPYENLALEEALLNRVGEGELILYLWQNERSVVIGRNQNPWKECRTALLAEEGGRLARRLSGGGAVFHDLGNLNFTFLMPAADYDLLRQLTVIERACQSLGIPAARSGRNDLLADGRKFSGSAFYKHAGKAYHHGTLMVDVDLEMVQRYLRPSKAKLAAKGVDSVRSRVVNLREFVPDLTIPRLADALIAALAEVYAEATGNRQQATGDRQQATGNETPVGAVIDRPPIRENLPDMSLRDQSADWSWQSVSPGPVQMLNVDDPDLLSLTEKYASDAWLYGPKLPFTLSVEDRFPWGGIEIQLDVNEGVIQSAKVYTDAMDETLAERLERRLIGSAFRREALDECVQGADLSDRQIADLRALLRKAL